MTDEPVRNPPVLGIDIGGSGIKGAPVDLATGELTSKRLRIPTPEKSTPENVAEVVGEIVGQLRRRRSATARSASPSRPWSPTARPARRPTSTSRGSTARPRRSSRTSSAATSTWSTTPTPPASPRCTTARPRTIPGLVLLTTLGTGIGTAIVYRGVLIPNSELGHLEIDGHDAETRAASSIKDKEGLSYRSGPSGCSATTTRLEALLWPDLIVVGGGVSKDSEKFLPPLNLNTEIVPAKLLNTAGIVGAAWLAADRHAHPEQMH